MKKLLIFILLLFSINSKAQTWVYHPFPDSAAVWNIDTYQWCGLGFDSWEHLYSIIIPGDTIINSVNYHKLSVQIEVVQSNGMCLTTGNWTIPGHYVGSVRQDTSVKKVFIVPPSDSVEQLLYDFNMVVGDTVKGFTEIYASPKDIVQSIDSVLVGSDYRKRWKINPCYGIYFIEGIGSTYGLIESSWGCVTDQAGFSITCFKQNGQTLYPDTTSACEIITSINSIENKIEEINIFPNPSNESFNINFSESLNITEIELTDILGKIILKQIINHKTNLKIDALKSGTYFLTLVSKDGSRINRKLISSP